MIEGFLHVGICVQDMDKSIKFYTSVMGMEIDYKTEHRGETPRLITGLDHADVDVCALTKGPVRIELLDFKNKEESAGYKIQNEPGLVHIAFLVSDIENEYEKIWAKGFQFNSPPILSREDGPKVCYFKGPDNVIIELYQPALTV